MRRAYNGEVWRDDQLNVVAVNLGSDFCAEHEWGISGIKSKFGISSKKEGVLGSLLNSKKLGIDARKITQSPSNLVYFDFVIETSSKGKKDHKSMFGIGMVSEWRTGAEPSSEFEHYIKGAYFEPGREEVLGFWAENKFMFLLESERDVTEFAEAFKKKDIAIWLGSSGPFKNGGLIIAIASRLPKSFLEEMEESDRDYLELKEAAEATGIHKILKESNREYYALSPKWKDETKKEVVFWLNPQHQKAYNFGWYGVEELKQWANGEGPIVKAE